MALMTNDETLGRLNDLIKVGEVSSINPAAGTARVVFDDDDSIVSYDLPILQRNTLNTQDFHSVVVGEDVLCLFLPSGPEEGFILGSFYAGEITPPESAATRRTTVFEDGTIVRYDMSSHTLTVGMDEMMIVADRSTVLVKGPVSVTLDTPAAHVTGTLTVDGAIVGRGGLAVSGGSGATVTGSITTTGDVTAAGISLQQHVHREQGDGALTSQAQ